MSALIEIEGVNEGGVAPLVITDLEWDKDKPADQKIRLEGVRERDWFISRYVAPYTFGGFVEMASAVACAWFIHPRTSWNVARDRTEQTWNHSLKPALTDELTIMLASHFYPEVYKVNPEGNSSAPSQTETEEMAPETRTTKRQPSKDEESTAETPPETSSEQVS